MTEEREGGKRGEGGEGEGKRRLFGKRRTGGIQRKVTGFSKGEKGKGKGKGKGDDWGQQSYGKGYQGYCHACGELGHKANEGQCKVQEVGIVGTTADCSAVEVGTVWNFCATEIGGEDKPLRMRKRVLVTS